jgi:hypothetical protein
VLVALRATGLNRIDVLVREGGFAAAQMPIVLGAEGAGEVAEIGPGASGFAPGDRVVINPFVACGECPACAAGRETECPNLQVAGGHFDGTYAEYIALPARSLLSAPDGLGYPELAASIVAYMTAWHMLKTKGGAVHRAALPGLRFAGLGTRAARRHSRWNQRTKSRPGGRLHGTPRRLLKILPGRRGGTWRVCGFWEPWAGGGYASAQVPSAVRVSPRLASRPRLRAAARLASQALLAVMPR